MGASTGSATGAQDPTSASSLGNAAAGIATGAATGGWVGASIATAGAVLSFVQASKQMQLQRQAEQDAAKALEEAKRQINVNPFAALGINKEAYEREREALLSQGAQAIGAGQEAGRGAAATAGRIYAGQVEAQAGQREAMSKEMQDLSKLTAQEQADINTNLASISLEETKGYQQQAADAAKARANAIEQAYQSGAKALEYGLNEVPLIIGKGRKAEAKANKAEAKANMANIGYPTVTPPSQKLVAGALTPLQSRTSNAITPAVSTLDQYGNFYNSGDYNYFNPYQ